MTYTLTSGPSVIRDADGVAIPNDPTMSAWQNYQDWLAAGNTPNPVTAAPPAVPQSVTDKQFFQAAGLAGIITKLEAIAFMSNGAMPASLATALSSMPSDQQYAATMAILGVRNFVRTDPFVIELSEAMGKTPAEVDALFTLAASL